MYTIKIESVNKDNGNPYASVSFVRDLGRTEIYKELVTDAETGINDWVEKTRPAVEIVTVNFNFTSKEDLDRQILAKKNQLESLQAVTEEIPVGEYTPAVAETPDPIVDTTPIITEPTAEQVFVTTVNRLKNALAMSAVGAISGQLPNETNQQYIAQGLAFVQAEVTEHPEYLDLVDLSALLPLLKP